MTGAIGPANMWGSRDEPKWKLMRVDACSTVRSISPMSRWSRFPQGSRWLLRKAMRTATGGGLLGLRSLAELPRRPRLRALHRLFRHRHGCSTSPTSMSSASFFAPEDDGRFTILGVADSDGKPSVPGDVQAGDHSRPSMAFPSPARPWDKSGRCWEATPGKERKLTIERERQAVHGRRQGATFLAESRKADRKDLRRRNEHTWNKANYRLANVDHSLAMELAITSRILPFPASLSWPRPGSRSPARYRPALRSLRYLPP